MNTILQNQLKSKAYSLENRFFVDYADLYVNIVMLTCRTGIVLLCTIFSYISRYSVDLSDRTLNVVFASNPAFLKLRVNKTYP